MAGMSAPQQPFICSNKFVYRWLWRMNALPHEEDGGHGRHDPDRARLRKIHRRKGSVLRGESASRGPDSCLGIRTKRSRSTYHIYQVDCHLSHWRRAKSQA